MHRPTREAEAREQEQERGKGKRGMVNKSSLYGLLVADY